MTKRERVVVLLGLLDEWVPGPRIARLWRWGSAGAGDGYVSDRADGVALAAVAGEDFHGRVRRRDGELRRLARSRRVEAGEVDVGELEPWEAAKRALYRSGSFPELLQALEELAGRDIVRFTAVRLVFCGSAAYGDGTRRVFGPLVRADAEAGLDWLERRLGDPVRVPVLPSEVEVRRSLRGARGWRGERARLEQDAEIRALVAGGVSLREAGDRFGLSHEQVRKIVRNGEAA